MSRHTGAAAGRHVCPIRPCFTQVSDRLLMCPDHWRLVPRELQRAVYAAYAGGAGLGTVELLQAQAVAVMAVHDALGLVQ